MWNPLYFIALLVLVGISIPLAVLAVFTTSIAILFLSFRALQVYFDLAIAVISAWLTPSSPNHISSHRSSLVASAQQSPSHHRQRSSTVSTASSHDTTVPSMHTSRLLKHKNNSLSTLVGTGELTRDFEGVGGWRVAGDDDEEALWMGINSRLQLPAEAPRRHKRSATGGASPSQRWSVSSEALRMSPVQSRSRTPVRFVMDDESGYFPPQYTATGRRLSTSSNIRQHRRRKSGSGSSISSTSSNGSMGLTMAVKEVGL
ncbi:hypothetical protein GMOD_00000103 [Pyrenophora seminiperda CCB06]|uniref:Uncharacterized protein n=1 Tax=Pyrenophora seminiperda CCB06 TaxID=1302712 RepID=A0A3M7M6H4_9PLEO|nr:hypothetical protein GMOD_00000103 [Pyrenophora seminiperda CCB06]